MPRSRKRHHSRSRSRSRSHSHDRSHEKHRKIDSHEKDGKRRKIEPYDSPQKRSVSSEEQVDISNENTQLLEETAMRVIDSSTEVTENEVIEAVGAEHKLENKSCSTEEEISMHDVDSSAKVTDKDIIEVVGAEPKPVNKPHNTEEDSSPNLDSSVETNLKISKSDVNKGVPSQTNVENDCQENKEEKDHASKTDEDKSGLEKEIGEGQSGEKDVMDSGDKRVSPRKDVTTPKKPLTPKQGMKRLESERKRQQRLKEKEDRERKKQEERDRIRDEKLKQKHQKEAEKQKLLEQKQKERELKEEQKRKEKEEKEQKRKEKEEREEQKRKERELEKLKRQQEIDEKNLEKQREEEKKQKTAAAFVNFFVPKKSSDSSPDEKKTRPEKVQLYFMPFEIKSDMRLPPNRRIPLTDVDKQTLVKFLENQDLKASYLKELKSGSLVRRSFKTWPYKDQEDIDDVTIIEEDSNLGQSIGEAEDTIKTTKARAKYLHFHDNRRPPYFGTWRKKSKDIKPRRPFAEDTEQLNYEEDSDDDWEEEEQGESLDVSDDDKENEEEKDDYEVDNEFFVPHGHLSDDEVDDEANARLSPESLKQKLKLLKDEFEEDIKSKTHKLKPRSIGCVWYNKKGDNVDEAIHRYLLPFAMITNGQIQIKKRSEIFINSSNQSTKKVKPFHEIPVDHVPVFLKIVHGNVNRKRAIAEEFLTYMSNNGYAIDISKADILRNLKQLAEYKKVKENGRTKFCWLLHDSVREKYNISVDVSPKKAD